MLSPAKKSTFIPEMPNLFNHSYSFARSSGLFKRYKGVGPNQFVLELYHNKGFTPRSCAYFTASSKFPPLPIWSHSQSIRL